MRLLYCIFGFVMSVLSPRLAGRFARTERGAVMVEVALLMPILVVILLGGYEGTRYILLHQKLDRVTTTAGDLISQASAVTPNELANVYDSIEHIMRPFTIGADGIIIITSVGRNGANNPHVNWQDSGGGTYSAASKIGLPAADATLPGTFTIDAGETVIIAELYYNFTPTVFPDSFAAAEFYKVMVFKPRLAPLDTIEPNP